MTDLSRKTVLIWDASASYTHIAEALVADFGRVLYHVPRDEGFPTSLHAIPGEGVDGIEVADDFFDALEDVDLCVFTDVGMGGLQEWLRRQGMPVFGSGAGQKLERDRHYLKSVCKKIGVDSAPSMPIRGLANLRALLTDVRDVYVKLSYWRGDKETFKYENPLKSDSHVDEIAVKMGPYQDLADFVVEQQIGGDKAQCVEVGADPPANILGMYPDTCLWGYEVKDKAYGGRATRLPARVRAILDKFAPILKEIDYRGPLSTETRETPDGSFFLDATMRLPEPPSSLQSMMVRNLGEIYYEGAHGRLVEPDYIAQVGVQIVIKSEYGAEHPVALTVGMPDRVAIHGHAVINGQDWAASVAEIAECAGAVGMANSLEDAMAEAIEAAESVDGRDISFDKGALDELMETIQSGSKLGLGW